MKLCSGIIVRFLLTLLIIPVFGATIALSDPSYTGELPPEGEACSGTSQISWIMQTRTPWRVVALVPAPDGSSPGEWVEAASYLQSFHQIVGQESQLSAMPAALLQLWQEPETVRLYVELERQLRIETRTLECVEGVWQVTSDSTSNETESSEWIGLMEDVVQRSTVSAPAVLEVLQSKLANANNQPGADTRPHHSYTVVQP